MEERRFVIRKVPIDQFIDILTELYNTGLDFVDIGCIQKDDIEDTVVFSYDQSYMDPEAGDEQFEEIKKLNDFPSDNKGLTDEDINRITLL